MNNIKSANLGYRSILFSLILLLFISPIFFVLGISSSNALGISFACILIAVLFYSNFVNINNNNKKLNLSIILILITIIGHSLIALILVKIDFYRLYLSLVPLIIIIIGGHSLSNILHNVTNECFYRALRIIILIFICIIFYSLIIKFYIFEDIRIVYPFSEPSHFSLAFVPFLAFFILITKNNFCKVLWLAFAIFSGVALNSLTLLVGVFLILLIIIKLDYVFLFIIFIIIAFNLNSDISYYIDRLSFFSEDNTNISGLVYLQGWQMIDEALVRSSYWGLGFQQLGVFSTDTDAGSSLQNLIGQNELPNVLDGGFTFSKFVSEFGLLGFIVFASYLSILFTSFKLLHKFSRNDFELNPRQLFCNTVIVTSLLEIFVRGVGYFSISSVLLSMALFYKYDNIKKNI